MNRRQVLAAGTLAVAGPFAGCLDDSPSVLAPAGSARAPPEGCGRADQPLSDQLTDDPGGPATCPEGEPASLAVENERKEPVTVDVAVADFTGTYPLAPHERTVTARAFAAQSPSSGTVTVDDEAWRVEWPEGSCRRHGIAVGDQPEVGWVAPLRSPAGARRDCYPGTPVPLRIDSTGGARTVTVTVTDECSGDRTERTLTLAAGTSERLDALVETGGRYTVTIDVDGVTRDTVEFHDACGGLVASIFRDRSIRIDEARPGLRRQ